MTTGYQNVIQSSSQQQFSFGEALWDSIIKPGMTPFLQMAMNLVFVTLFAILIFLMVATNFNFHVVTLFLISMMLFVSLQWYLRLTNSNTSLLTAAATTGTTPSLGNPSNHKETATSHHHHAKKMN